MSGPSDEVLLRIPARPEFGRLVRVGGAALGIRQGLSFTEIDDLRLAIDEAVIMLLDGSDAGAEHELIATFRFVDGRIEMELVAGGEIALRADAIDRFDEVCGALIDEYTIDAASGWLRVRKTPAQLD